MSLSKILSRMRTSGVRIVPRRLGLAFQYPKVLDPGTLADFRGYEADIVDCYGERAAIREFDGRINRDDAERAAVEDLLRGFGGRNTPKSAETPSKREE
jgi:hypothetical protein